MNASDNAVSRCWSCHGPVNRGAAFCPTCSAIQPPHACDPFRTLGLAPGFDIDSADLEQRYF
ncbi:MAG: Fe-S protein assembly co-chaperone HscB, partial [Proteobacteria bacterium]|nr:Fe-S protein assembly co-chaperone HscB [Pseudomonadota bacterium]